MTREEAINKLVNARYADEFQGDEELTTAHLMVINALKQEPTKKCKWIKYDYRTMCPKEHDVDNPYWRIPENRMETLKYCPYCGKEMESE